MPTWYDDFWDGVKAAIASAWPDVPPKQVYSDVQAQKRDWTNLLDSQQVVPPWVVAKIDIQPTDEWGVGQPRKEVVCTIYRIEADSAPQTSGAPAGTRIVNYLTGKLVDLENAVLYGSDVPGTVLSNTVLNANTDNPIDTSMLAADQRFTAGSLQFTTIIVT
jgi:hypothetical protein